MQFTNYSKANPVVSGIVGVWGLGVLTFLIRSMPMYLFQIAIKQFTVRVVISSFDDSFYHVIRWYEKVGLSKRARTLRLNRDLSNYNSDKNEILSAGHGNHYFFFCGLPFCLSRYKDSSSSERSSINRENLEIITIGRSQRPIRKLLESANPRISATSLTRVFKWSETYWMFAYERPVRDFKSIILSDQIKMTILEHLDNFKNDRSWYESHCIPYRTGICLYGPPGTGKTSLVRAVCGLYEKDLYILNLNTVTDITLEMAFDSLDEKSVVLIEDIDSCVATNKRCSENSLDESLNSQAISQSGGVSLTLSGILNAIDGIACSQGRILIITTNKIENLDSALLRPGRIDLSLYLGNLTTETVSEAFSQFYPNFKMSEFAVRSEISPATFQNLACKHKRDPMAVLKEISYH